MQLCCPQLTEKKLTCFVEPKDFDPHVKALKQYVRPSNLYPQHLLFEHAMSDTYSEVSATLVTSPFSFTFIQKSLNEFFTIINITPEKPSDTTLKSLDSKKDGRN